MKFRFPAKLPTESSWRTTPRRYIVIFLFAVFFVFGSFGFQNDSSDFGRQPALRVAIGVALIGLFATIYAASGIILRRRFWIAFLPFFLLQNACMTALNNWLPEAPEPTHIEGALLHRMHNRLTFDAVAAIIFVTLSYLGFLIVSISESRRRLRIQLDKAQLESELAAAREIQRVMVPDELPPAPGYAIESIYRTSAQVGGDFYQVLALGDGRTIVVLGDVSGKGISAAMIVSMLIGMLRVLSSIDHDPAEILTELNSRLFERKTGGFVTCIALCLDPQGHVAIANAGHLAPWLNGSEIALAGSVPLGILAAAVPECTALEMRLADRLTLLTDGVVEARDAQGVLFGFDRVQSMIRQGATPLALAEAALRHGQDDDLTVISIQRTA